MREKQQQQRLAAARVAFMLLHHRFTWQLARAAHASQIWCLAVAAGSAGALATGCRASFFCRHSSAPFRAEGGWIRLTVCLRAQAGAGERTCQTRGPEAHLPVQIMRVCPNWPPLRYTQQINLNKR